jgi:hypothetical protein
MTTYVIKYKDMWIDDYIVNKELLFHATNHKCGHSHKCHTMTSHDFSSLPHMIGALKWWLQTSRTIVVVIWNIWLCTWQASIEFGLLDEKLNYHYSY